MDAGKALSEITGRLLSAEPSEEPGQVLTVREGAERESLPSPRREGPCQGLCSPGPQL